VAREDDERRAARRERHLRRLDARHPRCADCGETDPAALIRAGEAVRCYECACRAAGRPTSEAHHLFGRANDSGTAMVPANLHRRLSDEQRDWPQDTLRNPRRTPLREIAAALRAQMDQARVFVERAEWMPRFLEQLDDLLDADDATKDDHFNGGRGDDGPAG
jgi:hypothetical protein